jgi:hypothetical protein
VPTLAALRHAPWSQSKLQTARTCARQFHYRYVERIAEREVSPEQRLGKALHLSLEKVLAGEPLDTGLAAGRAELLDETELARYDVLAGNVEPFLRRIAEFRARRRPRTTLVEHGLAIDAQLQPTSFVADDAFYRGILDMAFHWGEGELAVLDHKTGLRQSLDRYTGQLDGYAVLALAHAPGVRRLWRGVHFLATGEVEWAPPIEAAPVREELTPRLLQVIEEAGKAVAVGDVPTPGSHCTWCAYRSICPAAPPVILDGGGEPIGVDEVVPAPPHSDDEAPPAIQAGTQRSLFDP